MPSCVEHRPESVSYFEERVASRVGGFTCVAVDHGALRPGYGREGGRDVQGGGDDARGRRADVVGTRRPVAHRRDG